VPETTILGVKPGQVFTHRNIANIICPSDISMLSIVEFAVFHIKVKHIVLCGHTSCGGVAASLANSKLDILDVWLQPLRLLINAIRERGLELHGVIYNLGTGKLEEVTCDEDEAFCVKRVAAFERS
jgi:carbonic anhydrase